MRHEAYCPQSRQLILKCILQPTSCISAWALIRARSGSSLTWSWDSSTSTWILLNMPHGMEHASMWKRLVSLTGPAGLLCLHQAQSPSPELRANTTAFEQNAFSQNMYSTWKVEGSTDFVCACLTKGKLLWNPSGACQLPATDSTDHHFSRLLDGLKHRPA